MGCGCVVVGSRKEVERTNGVVVVPGERVLPSATDDGTAIPVATLVGELMPTTDMLKGWVELEPECVAVLLAAAVVVEAAALLVAAARVPSPTPNPRPNASTSTRHPIKAKASGRIYHDLRTGVAARGNGLCPA